GGAGHARDPRGGLRGCQNARRRALRAPRRPDGPKHLRSTHRTKELMDRTLILVKPDAFARGLSGEIIARFERKGLKILALRSMTVERELAERHYAEH